MFSTQPETTWVVSAIFGHSYFRAHHKLTYLIWRNWKSIFDMEYCGSLRIIKNDTEIATFRSGDTSLRDEPKLGCSSDLGQGAQKEFVECNRCKGTRELVLDLNTSQSAISWYLKKMRKVNKKCFWVSQTLCAKNKEYPISITTSSFKAEKWHVSQQYRYRWRKRGPLWPC